MLRAALIKIFLWNIIILPVGSLFLFDMFLSSIIIMSSLLSIPLLPLVEIIVHFLWLHTYLQASSVATQFTIGPVVFADLTLPMSEDTSKYSMSLIKIVIKRVTKI